MKILPYSDFPKNHLYYRTSSPTYKKYLQSSDLVAFDVGEKQYAWKKRLLGDWFVLIKYERIDVEPDIEMLKKKFSLKHAWIIWIPSSRNNIPSTWKKFYMQTHFIFANVTILCQQYYKKWSSRAQRARKKALQNGIKIVQVSHDTLLDAFTQTPVRHIFKRDYIEYYRKMSQIEDQSLRSYIAYYNDIPIAGLGVHDYYESSVHLIAFTNRKYTKLQAGTALIDAWFADSLKLGLKYIDFDRLREPYGPKDQQGYTNFKTNFIEYKTKFQRAYFKIF